MNVGCAGKTDRTRAIPEHLRGVFMTRRYTNPCLPLPYLPLAEIQTLDLLMTYLPLYRSPHLNNCMHTPVYLYICMLFGCDTYLSVSWRSEFAVSLPETCRPKWFDFTTNVRTITGSPVHVVDCKTYSHQMSLCSSCSYRFWYNQTWYFSLFILCKYSFIYLHKSLSTDR